LHDVERTFGVGDDFAFRILLPERVDLRHREARVDRAVPLPQQQLRAARLLDGKTAADFVGIPDGHALQRHADLVRGVAPQMLVWQHHQPDVARSGARPRPRHYRRGVGRGADDAVVLAYEAFDVGRRIDVGD